MAYWFPEFNLGFQCRIPESAEGHTIFYFEALAVTCTILQYISYCAPRMVIYTDSQNTVDIWHLLKASAPYNHLLILTIDKLINLSIDACVLHIPGIENTVADALLRFKNDLALKLVAGLKIMSFQPPHGMLGATKK